MSSTVPSPTPVAGVADGVTVPRPLVHVPALDGLRGIAVLLVVTSHLNLLVPRLDITRIGLVDGVIEGGYLGVDLFFVLSGFLITALILSEERGRGEIRFGSFYARRALRLLPALYFMLLCHAAYTLLTELNWDQELASLRAAVFYYSNWQVVFDLQSVATGTNHLWSLAVEEQFYLVWPVVLVGLFGLQRSARTVAVALVTAIVGIALWRAHLWNQGAHWLELFVRTDTRADTLLVGALLGSLWVRAATPRRGVVTAGWVGLVVAVGYLATVEASSGFSFKGGSTLFAVAVALVLLAVLDGGWAPTRVLETRPLRAVGRVSYGLYLWHFPMFHAVARYGGDLPEGARVVIGLTLSAAATLVSWFGLERPLSSYRHRLRLASGPA